MSETLRTLSQGPWIHMKLKATGLIYTCVFASLAAVEPDPVPVEDVIEAAVAEDTAAASPPGMPCGQQSQLLRLLIVKYTQWICKDTSVTGSD